MLSRSDIFALIALSILLTTPTYQCSFDLEGTSAARPLKSYDMPVLSKFANDGRSTPLHSIDLDKKTYMSASISYTRDASLFSPLKLSSSQAPAFLHHEFYLGQSNNFDA